MKAKWLKCVTRVVWVTERATMSEGCAELASLECALVGSDKSGTPGNPSIKCEIWPLIHNRAALQHDRPT